MPGLLLEDAQQYSLVDPEFYEPLDRYQPNPADYIELTDKLVPATWRRSRSSIWYNCSPPVTNLPRQGWKIHLSATLSNARVLLATAATYLVEEEVSFKHAADKLILYMLNGKRWPRGGAGKFMTIYPNSPEHCRHLLDGLYQEMIGYRGPYILSDKRYRDSSVVHYRYGGILPTRRIGADGRQAPVIEAPGGEIVEDERRAYFYLPPGVTDVFSTDDEAEAPGDGTLKNGRYKIDSVLTFSTSGGVYTATDRETGEKVLIKEARPLTNQSPRGTDAVWLLKKEHRLLKKVQHTGVAPRPIDFFADWEHFYLVEEFVEGRTLRGHNAVHSLPLRTRPEAEHAAEFFAQYRDLYKKIATALQALHDHGIVFSDMSHYNVIVMDDGASVKFIDFEGAYEIGLDSPSFMYTPGFAPDSMMADGAAEPADDRYGLGGLMLSSIFPVNDIMILDSRAYEPFLDSHVRDLGFPAPVADCIRGLLHPDRARRPHLSEVIRALEVDHTPNAPNISTFEADIADPESIVRGLLDYIDQVTTPERDDRLVPAAPMVFQTNSLGIAYGACGVAYVMNRIRGSVPPAMMEWILKRPLSLETHTSGLYVGLSGIAWTFLELGLRDRAEEVLRLAQSDTRVLESPDLFHGVAGRGLAQLKFFAATQDEQYLARAVESGEFLMDSRKEEDGKCWWENQGFVYCGLGHGTPGVSLFLLYLSLATGDERYMRVGRQGLAQVLDSGSRNPDGGLSFLVREDEVTRTPYWRWGSAGVGITLLRYLAVADDPLYRQALDDIHLDTDRKFSIFPGQHLGLAGLGEFYVDWANFDPADARTDASARKVLSGILPFMLRRKQGLAFPGETRARISCDFGTGSAGIAFYLHRMLTKDKPAFMVDELLEPPALSRIA